MDAECVGSMALAMRRCCALSVAWLSAVSFPGDRGEQRVCRDSRGDVVRAYAHEELVEAKRICAINGLEILKHGSDACLVSGRAHPYLSKVCVRISIWNQKASRCMLQLVAYLQEESALFALLRTRMSLGST